MLTQQHESTMAADQREPEARVDEQGRAHEAAMAGASDDSAREGADAWAKPKDVTYG